MNVAAKNPVTSPTTPPPKARKVEERSQPYLSSLENIFSVTVNDFASSPWGREMNSVL